MLLHFSNNPFQAAWGILRYNYKAILWFVFFSTIIWVAYKFFGIDLKLPVVPVSILGGALAIFLAFRNNSAYDRWWEARKVWGSIVNLSRSFAMETTGILGAESKYSRILVFRHIAWINALRIQLRKQDDFSELDEFLDPAEFSALDSFRNKATMLLQLQGKTIGELKKEALLSDIEQMQLMESIKKMYDAQGMNERIKNTVFPHYYVYFTKLFFWVFVLMLPCAMVESAGIMTIPISLAISFVFYILDKSGTITEDPFEGRAADTPMSSICRTIEIDLKQQLNETVLPNSIETKYTLYKAAYVE